MYEICYIAAMANQNGKGDTRRPMQITDGEWAENYNRIFRGNHDREIQKKFDEDYWKDCKNQAAKEDIREIEAFLSKKYLTQLYDKNIRKETCEASVR